jgi:hypothetical protein
MVRHLPCTLVGSNRLDKIGGVPGSIPGPRLLGRLIMVRHRPRKSEYSIRFRVPAYMRINEDLNGECPTCGKDGMTDHGVKTHHSHMHDSPIPNVKCDICGEKFYSRSKKSYCEECFTMKGENNPRYSDAKKESVCEVCGNTFEYYPSSKKGKYCGECVEEKGQFWGNDNCGGSKSVSEENIYECGVCGEEVVRYEDQDNYFCSVECSGKWKSGNIVGENHHNYTGGPSNRGSSWYRSRRNARERYNGTCQICGKQENIEVHHIIPVCLFDHPDDSNDKFNLICLCESCHPNPTDKHFGEGQMGAFYMGRAARAIENNQNT